tara:strand:+ start:625 stop:891 length:267 start_codon:yes stop_codon:yes gene_type:complete
MSNKTTNRIYVGNGVEKFDGDMVEFSLNLTKLGKEATDHMFEYNGEKFIKLKVAKMKETNDYGKTHYVEVNTFKPEAKKEAVADDLPF